MDNSKETPFPAQDSPPHPEELKGKGHVVTQAVAEFKKKFSVRNAEAPAAIGEPSPQEVRPSSKKPFLKILFAVAFFLLLGVLIFLAIKLKPSGGALFGTKGEIVWWGFQLEESAITPLIEEYQKQNPDVKIKYQKQSPLDYRERLTNALASGKGPDIFEIHNSWTPMFKADLAPFPTSVFSPDEFRRDFYPVITTDLMLNNEVLAVPLEYDAITLFINEDIFASAAKSPPRTWDELRDLAIELTQKDERNLIIQSGVSLGLTQNIDYWPEILALMIFQNQVSPAKLSGKLSQDAIDFYLIFSKTDKVWDDSLPPSTLGFAREKVAMYFGPTRRTQEITQTNSNLRFKTVSLPQLPKERPTDPDVSYATYWAQGVWGKSKNKELAWQFLKYLSSAESLSTLNEERLSQNLLERPYPRIDLAQTQLDNKILGSVVALAPKAKSWYLADETFDGPTGINSQINKVFETVVSKIYENDDPEKALLEGQTEISKILSSYKIVAK